MSAFGKFRGKRKNVIKREGMTRDQRDIALERKARRQVHKEEKKVEQSSSSSESEGSDVPDDWLCAFGSSLPLPPSLPLTPSTLPLPALTTPLPTSNDVSTRDSLIAPPVFKGPPLAGYYFESATGKYFKHTPESRRKESAEIESKRKERLQSVVRMRKMPSFFHSLSQRQTVGAVQSRLLCDSVPSHLTSCFPLLPLLGFSAECGLHFDPSSRLLTVAGAEASHPGPGECQVGTFTLTDNIFSSCNSALSPSLSMSSSLSTSFSPWLLNFNHAHATVSRVTNIKRFSSGAVGPSVGLKSHCGYLFESTLGSSQSAALRIVEDESNIQQVVFEHKVSGSLWDFDCNPFFFSGVDNVCLGASKRGYLLHLSNKNTTKIPTEGSDVLTQHFVDSNLVASGCRDGRVRYFDLRTHMRSGRPGDLTTPSSVCWMHSMPQGTQIVVSCINGSLLCLDRRSSKPLLKLEHHMNSHSRLRGYVNDTGTQLFMGGEDGLIRAWSLTDGQLLLASSALKDLGASLDITSDQLIPTNIEMVNETILVGTAKGVFGLTFAF